MGTSSRLAVCTAACLLALVACGGSSTGSPSTTSTPTATTQAAGACSNSLLPVVKGASWTLSSQNPPIEVVIKITDVTATSFVMEGSIMGIATSQTGHCTSEGLTNISASSFLSTGPSGMSISSKVLSSSGVSLPPNVQPGDAWTESSTSEAQVAGVTVTLKSTSRYTAIGIDQVTVPAGKFESVHIKVETSTTIEGDTDATVFSSDIWLGRQKGYVKMAASVKDSSGTGQTVELVLTKYTVS